MDFILVSLELSCTKEISPLLFNLALGMFLKEKQMQTEFFPKISQEWCLPQLLCYCSFLLPLELPQQYTLV